MTKSEVFTAWVKGTPTQVRAFKKINAVARFQQLDSAITPKDVKKNQCNKFAPSAS